MININLKGEWKTRRVWLNGKEILPTRSQKLVNHSPDGFNWSYGGSGPAQLALAICLELFDTDRTASRHDPLKFNYQEFKWKYIATLPKSDFEATIQVDESLIIDKRLQL